MPRNANHFRLGLALLTMFALFVASLIYIGGRGLAPSEMRMMLVRFDAFAGMPEIVVGSRVLCFGQEVGTVKSAEIVVAASEGADSPELHFLDVRASVRADIRLRTNCRVLAAGPPLGGKGLLDIVDPGDAEEALEDGSFVRGYSSGFQAALAQLNAELDVSDATSLLARLKAQLDENNPDGLLSRVLVQLDPENPQAVIAGLQRSVRDINAVTAQLAREVDRGEKDRLLVKLHLGLDRLNANLDEFQATVQRNRPVIDAAIDHIAKSTETLNERILPRIADELDAEQVRSTLARVHAVFDRLDTSLADLNKITGRSREVVTLNAGRIDHVVENASEASASLNRGIRDLSLHPWRILAKPGANDQQAMQIVDVARRFTEAAAHLDDATVRLKALADAYGSNIDGDGMALETIRADLAESVRQYRSAEEALWSALSPESTGK